MYPSLSSTAQRFQKLHVAQLQRAHMQSIDHRRTLGELLNVRRQLARLGHALEDTRDLRRRTHKRVVPEAVVYILDQLDEGDEEAPGVWPAHDQALQKYSRNLLLQNFLSMPCLSSVCGLWVTNTRVLLVNNLM